MRMDQFIGLNEWASRLVQGCGKPHFFGEHKTERVVLPDGTEGTVDTPVLESCVLREENGDFYLGMFGDLYPLLRYTFRHGDMTGRVLTEYVQAAPWSSGPVFFLALKDEGGNPVPESLWNDEDIKNA